MRVCRIGQPAPVGRPGANITHTDAGCGVRIPHRSENSFRVQMKALLTQSPRQAAKLSSRASTQTPVGQVCVWKARIENCDAKALWRALHRMVSAHPLVRSALGEQPNGAGQPQLFSLHDL